MSNNYFVDVRTKRARSPRLFKDPECWSGWGFQWCYIQLSLPYNTSDPVWTYDFFSSLTLGSLRSTKGLQTFFFLLKLSSPVPGKLQILWILLVPQKQHQSCQHNLEN